MNLSTVANNLRATIAGKEQMLAHMNENCGYASTGQVMAHNATVEFLKINIDELKRVLRDVEQCAKQASDDSWITNPDRMGGCYSEDEMRNEGWK
jgi:hypothetical protein